jgi:hypothetical protein
MTLFFFYTNEFPGTASDKSINRPLVCPRQMRKNSLLRGRRRSARQRSIASTTVAAAKLTMVQHQRPLYPGVFFRSTDRCISNDANFVAEHGRKC